jgi:hypothetical protein
MTENDFGVQPLDRLMTKMNIEDTDLVKASTQQLTFKMVKKARKGRRLTPKVKYKVLNALNALDPDYKFKLRHLFNYR